MPANKFALLRYRIIDRYIRNRGSKAYPSKEDLRQACEEALYGSDGEHISMSTIDKDIWAMRNEGELGYYAPIVFSKEYGGYYYDDPEYTIAELPLSEEDLHAIKAAAETLFQFREIPLFKQFDSAIEKILDRMKISGQSEKEENEVIQFEKLGAYRGSEFLQPLFNACANQTEVSIAYQKFQSNEVKSYRFHPYILKEYRSRWYVIGMDASSNTFKTFGLDRIKSVEVLDLKFHMDAEFNPRSFFEHSVGITVNNDAPQEVVLDFDQSLAPYIISQPLHASQQVLDQSEGRLQICIEVIISIELISSILGFGAAVKVVSPSTLKDRVKETLIQCLNQYEK